MKTSTTRGLAALLVLALALTLSACSPGAGGNGASGGAIAGQSQPAVSPESAAPAESPAPAEPDASSRPTAQVVTRSIQEESDRLKADIKYPEVSGLGSTVDAVINQRMKTRALESLAAGREAAKNGVQAPGVPQQSAVGADYRVSLNGDGLLSLVFTDYTFVAGAAHGTAVQTSDTFDVKTGRVYALSDLFRPGVDYATPLAAEVKRLIKERGLDAGQLTPFETIPPHQKFYLTDKDLVLYYDLYEYWAYVAGIQEFPIPLRTLAPDLTSPFAELVN